MHKEGTKESELQQTWADGWDGGPAAFELLSQVLRLQLKEGVVIVEGRNQGNVGLQAAKGFRRDASCQKTRALSGCRLQAAQNVVSQEGELFWILPQGTHLERQQSPPLMDRALQTAQLFRPPLAGSGC